MDYDLADVAKVDLERILNLREQMPSPKFERLQEGLLILGLISVDIDNRTNIIKSYCLTKQGISALDSGKVTITDGMHAKLDKISASFDDNPWYRT